MNITTIAGSGEKGYAGDGGPAAQASMDNPFNVDIDLSGRFLYIADCFNYCIRRVDLENKVMSTVAGTGEAGYTGDGGLATEAKLDEIYAIQVDTNGDVYIVQRFSPSIRKIDVSTGRITTVAGDGTAGYGGDGGSAIRAQMREPNDCALDGQGGLLIADVQDHRIRRLDIQTGIITTFAGTGDKVHSGDGGAAIEAGLFGARAVCVDAQGVTYICEREGNSIRKVDADGTITTIAGTGQKGYTGDGGPAIEATFNGPKAMRCDAEGNIFVVDTENHAIRKIDAATGTVTTVAGGHLGPEGDGDDATKAGLARPHSVLVDSPGAFYIADSENHRVRLVR